MTTANTPKTVANELRSALSAHPERPHPQRLGYLETAVQDAVERLDEQLDPRELAEELTALRESLIEHATCVRRKAGEPVHRISQLLGAMEASIMRLELLRDRLVRSSQPTVRWPEIDKR